MSDENVRVLDLSRISVPTEGLAGLGAEEMPSAVPSDVLRELETILRLSREGDRVMMLYQDAVQAEQLAKVGAVLLLQRTLEIQARIHGYSVGVDYKFK